jgi:hypothetical protein
MYNIYLTCYFSKTFVQAPVSFIQTPVFLTLALSSLSPVQITLYLR